MAVVAGVTFTLPQLRAAIAEHGTDDMQGVIETLTYSVHSVGTVPGGAPADPRYLTGDAAIARLRTAIYDHLTRLRGVELSDDDAHSLATLLLVTEIVGRVRP